MEKEYAEALENAVRKGGDEAALADGLVRHLKAEGCTKLLPGILRELKRMEARKQKLAPSVEAASEGEKAAAIAAARAAGINVAEAIVNPSLIKGWRARSGSTLVDRSAKRALLDIYQEITN